MAANVLELALNGAAGGTVAKLRDCRGDRKGDSNWRVPRRRMEFTLAGRIVRTCLR